MTVRDNLNRVMHDLETERDELAVKMHLAKADARDEWEKLESRWRHMKAKAEVLRDEAGEVAEDVATAAREVLDELKRGYDRLRKLV